MALFKPITIPKYIPPSTPTQPKQPSSGGGGSGGSGGGSSGGGSSSPTPAPKEKTAGEIIIEAREQAKQTGEDPNVVAGQIAQQEQPSFKFNIGMPTLNFGGKKDTTTSQNVIQAIEQPQQTLQPQEQPRSFPEKMFIATSPALSFYTGIGREEASEFVRTGVQKVLTKPSSALDPSKPLETSPAMFVAQKFGIDDSGIVKYLDRKGGQVYDITREKPLEVIETGVGIWGGSKLLASAGGMITGLAEPSKTKFFTVDMPVMFAESELLGKGVESFALSRDFTSKQSKDVAFVSRILQAEAFGNIVGGSEIARLGTPTTKWEGFKALVLPGFAEGFISTEATFDRIGEKEFFGVTFGDEKLFPSIKEKSVGKIGTDILGGTVGSLTAGSFGFVQQMFKKTKIGRAGTTTAGYLLDPAELPGDITTPIFSAGSSTTQVVTFAPALIPSVTKTTTPTPSTTKVPSIIQTTIPPITKVPTKVPSTVPPITKVPTKVPSTVPPITRVPSMVPPTVPPITDIPALVPPNVPSLVPPITKVPSTVPPNVPSWVFTPRIPIIIPPGLPGGGGGGGGFNFRKAVSRAARYQPSLLGIVKGKKRKKKGFLSGIEIRGISY